MDSLQFVIITHSEISTQKTLIFKKISVFICRKLVFLCLLFWSAYLRGGFHLELVHCVAGFRDVDVGRITVRHVVASPCLFSGNHLSISFTRSFSASAPIMNANSRREFHGNFDLIKMPGHLLRMVRLLFCAIPLSRIWF